MSLKAELEIWASALILAGSPDPASAIPLFDQIGDTSKIEFNVGLVLAALGRHAEAVRRFYRATELDRFLAVAWFQAGVSHFMLGNYTVAHGDFEQAMVFMRGNQDINYTQLGLAHTLHAAEILFNRGLCHLASGRRGDGMADLTAARAAAAVPAHDVIADAIRDGGREYNVFSVPAGTLFRPSEGKLRNLKARDYMGKAVLVAASDPSDTHTSFSGLARLQRGQGPRGAPLPAAHPLALARSATVAVSNVASRSDGAGAALGIGAGAASRAQGLARRSASVSELPASSGMHLNLSVGAGAGTGTGARAGLARSNTQLPMRTAAGGISGAGAGAGAGVGAGTGAWGIEVLREQDERDVRDDRLPICEAQSARGAAAAAGGGVGPSYLAYVASPSVSASASPSRALPPLPPAGPDSRSRTSTRSRSGSSPSPVLRTPPSHASSLPLGADPDGTRHRSCAHAQKEARITELIDAYYASPGAYEDEMPALPPIGGGGGRGQSQGMGPDSGAGAGAGAGLVRSGTTWSVSSYGGGGAVIGIGAGAGGGAGALTRAGSAMSGLSGQFGHFGDMHKIRVKVHTPDHTRAMSLLPDDTLATFLAAVRAKAQPQPRPSNAKDRHGHGRVLAMGLQLDLDPDSGDSDPGSDFASALKSLAEVRFRDEDGDMVVLRDEGDFEAAVDVARAMRGKLEVWVG